MTTKTIAGQTWYQSPTDPQMWHDTPAKFGTYSGMDLSELKDIKSQIRWAERELTKLDPTNWDDANTILELRDLINNKEEDVELLEELAR